MTTLTDYERKLEQARERFLGDTDEHEMTVRHDEGVYRHLRFQRPGSWQYGYDLVTWPGFLAYTGDMGEYLFARTEDMLAFFASGPGINPDYWGEKLKGPGHKTHLRFSRTVYRRRIIEWFNELSGPRDVERYVEGHDLLGSDVQDEVTARARTAHIPDSWEWSFSDYDPAYLWACWAIRTGIERYQEAQV